MSSGASRRSARRWRGDGQVRLSRELRVTIIAGLGSEDAADQYAVLNALIAAAPNPGIPISTGPEVLAERLAILRAVAGGLPR